MNSSSVDVSGVSSLFYKTAIILVFTLLAVRVTPLFNISNYVLIPFKLQFCAVFLVVGGILGIYCNKLIRDRELFAWRTSLAKISFYYICYVLFTLLGIILI